MPKTQAVLFDLDGTLLDTARDLGNSLNYLLQKHQLPLCEYEQYRPVASHGTRGLLALGFNEQPEKYDFSQLRTEFLDHYNNNLCVDTVLFPGTEQMLELLRQNQLPWGIVTNKPEFLTHELLPNFPALSDCAVVVCGDTLAQAKPHPAPLLYAAEQLQITPEHIWYVGDAQRDIEAAKAASMPSVLAEYGYISDLDKPATWQADFSIHNPQQLLTCLAN